MTNGIEYMMLCNKLQHQSFLEYFGIDAVDFGHLFLEEDSWHATTVSYDKQRMGQLASELLLNKMEGTDVQSLVLDSEQIVERHSVKNL